MKNFYYLGLGQSSLLLSSGGLGHSYGSQQLLLSGSHGVGGGIGVGGLGN